MWRIAVVAWIENEQVCLRVDAQEAAAAECLQDLGVGGHQHWNIFLGHSDQEGQSNEDS